VKIEVFIMLGVVFGLLAGASGYVITYGEYKQRMRSTSDARKAGMRSATVAFLFFFLAALALPWILQNVSNR
jgi:hypothetical protein